MGDRKLKRALKKAKKKMTTQEKVDNKVKMAARKTANTMGTGTVRTPARKTVSTASKPNKKYKPSSTRKKLMRKSRAAAPKIHRRTSGLTGNVCGSQGSATAKVSRCKKKVTSKRGKL